MSDKGIPRQTGDELMTEQGKTARPAMTGLMSALILNLFLFLAGFPYAADAFAEAEAKTKLKTLPIWYVSKNGSDITGTGSSASPFRTIQKGINVAVKGGTVKVMPGMYREYVSFKGKSIRVVSEAGPDETIIAGWDTITKSDSRLSVVTFQNKEGPDTVLSGFTIQEGSDGGIYCSESGPTLENLRIVSNSAGSGGGIFCDDGASPHIRNSFISDNSAVSNIGGGIFCTDGASPLLENVVIAKNYALNNGGGIWCGDNSAPVLINVTIADNTAGLHGSAIFLGDNSDLTLTNAIVRNNSIHIGKHYYGNNAAGTATISYSDIQGGRDSIEGAVRWGDGNIDADPLFRDEENGNYHLSKCSPCIGSGTLENTPDTDIEGNPGPGPGDVSASPVPDMGAYEHPLDIPDACGPAEIYVDSGSPVSDKDAGNGSAEMPYASISRAVSNATPDSTIRVAGGIYSESLALINISGLKLEGGWKNASGTWTRTAPPDPNLTVIMAFDSPAPLRLDRADNTLVQGFTIMGNSIGVRVDNSANADIRGNVIRIDCKTDSEGIRYAGSSGNIAENRIHMASPTGSDTGRAIRLSGLLTGDSVRMENNIIYLQGNHLTGIWKADANASPAALLNNEFYANANSPLFSDADTGENIKDCRKLNDGTLAGVPEHGGNFCHVLPFFVPCTPAPCADEVVAIPTPRDTDGDNMPDNWEIFYFGDISDNGTQDSDGDGLTDSEEYAGKTEPGIWDTDGDNMPDGWEVRNGTNPAADDAGEDPDNDGYSNLREYEKDSDPHDANQYPFAQNDEMSTGQNRAVTANVTENDSEEWVGLVSLVQPASGTADISSTETVTYTPAPDFWGKDFFDYTVSNSRGNRANATVTAYVRPLPVREMSLFFDGTDDYLIRSPMKNFPSGEITLEFWFKPSGQGDYPLISYVTENSDNMFSVSMNEDFNFRIYMDDKLKRATGLMIRDSVWHHIALTWRSSDGEIKIFSDGFPAFSGTFLRGGAMADRGSLMLGRSILQKTGNCVNGCQISDEAFEGWMDEVRIWNHVREETAIQTDMNRHLDGDENGLTAYWRFDGGEGDTAFDYSASGNHLDLGPAEALAGHAPVFTEDSPLVTNYVYVDWQNRTGTETGQAHAPYQTMGHAVANAMPGTVIRVAKGIYAETLSIVSINGLKLEGGWDNNAGEWHQDSPADPGATVLMPGNMSSVSAAAELDRAPNTLIRGFTIMGKRKGVAVRNASAVSIVNNIIHIPETNADAEGIRFENSSGHIAENRLHMAGGGNAVHGIVLNMLAGDVHVRNNIIFTEGGNTTAIQEEGADATPAGLVNNEFAGNENLVIYRDADGHGDITNCAYLNDGTLGDIPEQGGNFRTLLIGSDICAELPCSQVVAIPPPYDTDGDRIPDNWEVFYFGDISRDGKGDENNDGQTDLAAYVGKTVPVSWNLGVTISPDDAVISGCSWGIGTEWLDSGATLSLTGTHTVTFKEIPGWNAPGDQTMTFGDCAVISAKASYTRKSFVLDISGSGCGGSVKVGGEIYPLPWQADFLWDDQVTLEAVPDQDCKFAYWFSDTADTEQAITVRMDGAKSLEIVFVEKTGYFSPPMPTDSHMDMEGEIRDASGRPILPGDEVAALVSDGTGHYILAGHTLYGETGYAIHIYGDDPETPEKDGALAGDNIIFRTYSQKEDREYTLRAVTEGNRVWEAGKSRQWDWEHRTGQRIPLHTGWNLISFNVNKCYYVGEKPDCEMIRGIEYEAVTSIRDILSSIDGQYSYVRAFDCGGLKTYNLSEWSDMKYMAAGYGYEVRVNDDAAVDENGLVWLELEGDSVRNDSSLSLLPGWNLMGYIGDRVLYAGDQPPSVTFPAHTLMCRIPDMSAAFCAIEGQYDYVRGFDKTGVRSYNLTRWSDMKYVGPGYGYWIKVNEGENPAMVWDSPCVRCQE